jgi:diguanylate cyclase (GGDEF)-like protein
MRLLLIAPQDGWEGALRRCLAGLGEACTLACAQAWGPPWDAAPDEGEGLLVVLATPDCQPPAGRCAWPQVLLLDHEPQEPPVGASDWLALPDLNTSTLRRCLRHVRERSRLQGTLQRLAEEDPLTGIANRQGFLTMLATSLAGGDGRGLALGHLDLDNFRHANDCLGYQAGDRLILQVVARLKAQLEPGDRLARLGGDEFAVLIDTRRDSQRAERLAERIVDALGDPYWVDGESLLIGCSLGIAHGRLRTEPDPLMWHAHIAMRQAKSVQGCSFHVFNERINRNARSIADLEGELRRALRRDEFELHYQPRLDLSGHTIVGLEALVRWRHKERGLLAPSEFVPLAEQSGLIVPLGYWVLARALMDMQRLREAGIAPLHMAVNLSFRQFQDSQLLGTLSRLISERGIDASWLEFELTETAVMRRNDQVRHTMDALRQLGVRFSLDDFGTGFSSFVHLSSLPIALLKIDRSFVANMEERAESRQLVKAMVNLAHNLRLQVVAEGVETVQQLNELRAFGCDQVQGYLISRPMPLQPLMAYLQEGLGKRLSVGAGGSSRIKSTLSRAAARFPYLAPRD